MLGLTTGCQPVVLTFDGSNLVGHVLTEGACSPGATVTGSIGGLPGIDIPSHVHTELQLLLGRLNVAHVDDPQTLDALLVCPRELVADERG